MISAQYPVQLLFDGHVQVFLIKEKSKSSQKFLINRFSYQNFFFVFIEFRNKPFDFRKICSLKLLRFF